MLPKFVAALAAATFVAAGGGGSGGMPLNKVYGVNLGSWLILEPWMLPKEWVSMGGETCFMNGSCTECIASEFDLVKSIGQQRADQEFQRHWETWFTQSDVNDIKNAGLNTVRLPIGYWIIEPLVDRKTEFYPRGGIKQLQRGLSQLRDAGIDVLLDFHALPGVSASAQMFAGHCTTDVEFYTPPNYFRALQWAAVTTVFAHLDPAWSSVFAIEAINEEIMDATQTPDLGDYYRDFVLVVRAVELALGVSCDGIDWPAMMRINGNTTASASRRSTDDAAAANSTASTTSANSTASASSSNSTASTASSSNSTASSSNSTASNVTMSAATLTNPPPFTLPALSLGLGGRPGQVLSTIIPIIASVALELGLGVPLSLQAGSRGPGQGNHNGRCLRTTFMDDLWQNGAHANPADTTIGPALYDDHLYFNFGGVADPNPTSYLEVICNLPRVQEDNAARNVPMVFGEWALSTNFNATDDFLRQWADAQKLKYGQSSGWIFWSFKIEEGNSNEREWDYFEGIRRGYFTQNPAAFHDVHVCDRFVNGSSTS